ncbi:siderophore-interacting protein [Albimonas pacifica]|uniref:NADPH-dependent ferric siderophore reductase, contains FAD-binding and SIP domains n=1 Tax=Albimonas pacifica TaxID=1114924 RepID=A0A1I3BIH9_9RHOB|nr:siderophore-interacting protein [Albimonas pacifica]SFH61906.1 NADPH-dependent ferric siderophore reductase, contains FAD-binding and SIP domains [Albimonas pacifica]
MSAPLTAGALADLSDPQDALQRLAAMAEGWGLNVRPSDAGGLAMRGEGWAVDILPAPGGLSLAAEAGDEAILRGLKEMAEFMLADLSAEAAERLRWSDGARPGAPAADFREWTYLRRHAVMPGLDRLVFACADAARYAGAPMHVRLLVPPCDGSAAQWPRQKPNGGLAWPAGEATLAARVYTVRRADAASGEIEVDAVVHGDDLLAGWAARARPGWRLGVLGPSGAPPLDGPLMAGADLCALPALARILAASAGREGLAVVAAPAEAAAYLAPPAGIALKILPPDAGAEALADAFLEAAEARPLSPSARWWFAAEAAGVRRVRGRLDALGVARGRRDCVAYWRA